MPTIGELAAKFEILVRRKKAASAEEQECSKEMDALEQQLLDMMADEHLPNVKLDSGMTLYKRCDKFYGVAEGATKEQLVQALANCEHTMDLVEANYNSNSLRARMKEIEANGDSLPQEVLDLLKVTEKYKVGHRS
jgi:hypothetical protein